MASTLNASNSGAGGLISTADASGVLQLQSAGTTAVTIDTSQNVGIGTTSPQNDAGYKTLTVNGTSGGQVSFKTNDANIGSIYSVSTAFNLTTGTSIPMVFQTNGSERMRIDSNGWTYINCTSNVSAANAYQNILFNGDLYYGQAIKTSKTTTGSAFSVFVNSAGTTSGSITHNGTTTTAFNTSSDYRLKDNITPMADALQTVAKLKPVTYKWKVDGSDGQGFIAHELAEVVPDCVYGEKDAVDAEGNPIHQGVDTSFLVATLTAAIQEQQTIINDLKARVTALEAK